MQLICLDDSLKRAFYAELCRVERWSVRELRARLALSEGTQRSLSPDPSRVPAGMLDEEAP